MSYTGKRKRLEKESEPDLLFEGTMKKGYLKYCRIDIIVMLFSNFERFPGQTNE